MLRQVWSETDSMAVQSDDNFFCRRREAMPPRYPGNRLFGGNSDILDASVGEGSNRLYEVITGDTLLGGSSVLLECGDDKLFAGRGATVF